MRKSSLPVLTIQIEYKAIYRGGKDHPRDRDGVADAQDGSQGFREQSRVFRDSQKTLPRSVDRGKNVGTPKERLIGPFVAGLKMSLTARDALS